MNNVSILLVMLMLPVFSCTGVKNQLPARVVADLDLGESREITLSNGEKVKLALLDIMEVRDSLRNAIREVHVQVSIDGEVYTLGSGNYNLPVEAGNIQLDCPVVKSYLSNSTGDHWGLIHDARFRLWPAGSSWMEPGTFAYPLKQQWFAGMSQSGNEPTYVDWGENLDNNKIYYHAGHDFGGAEGMDEILSATDGLVISALAETLEGYEDLPGDIRPDVIWILTGQGWYIRYSHLDSVDPSVKPGSRVTMGQRLGVLGKQGYSGGWAHLHFEIKNRETASGKWGTEDAYAYLWEAYMNQYKPKVVAVARPHHLAWTGQQVLLDGSKSKSQGSVIKRYEWIFTDGSVAEGPVQKRSYTRPGEYSEILKVTDSEGHIAYDFAVVQVYDRNPLHHAIPVMQPAFHPTLDIGPGDPVTFLVRTFNTDTGNEVWDFGDGSPTVPVKSASPDKQNYTGGKFAETVHIYAEPGIYIVRVERADENGYRAVAHLHVTVTAR